MSSAEGLQPDEAAVRDQHSSPKGVQGSTAGKRQKAEQ